jgi:hypothetical protein
MEEKEAKVLFCSGLKVFVDGRSGTVEDDPHAQLLE